MTTTAATYEPLHRRPHTFLGVCEAIGEDFGFAPEWLRIAFGVGLFFNPFYAIGGYALLGLFVLASRTLFPNPLAIENRRLRREADAARAAEEARSSDNEEVTLPLAA